MSEHPQLDAVVDGVRRRSDPAFADLYRLTGDALASFAYSMLGDRWAAEDAVQQAFLELAKLLDNQAEDHRIPDAVSDAQLVVTDLPSDHHLQTDLVILIDRVTDLAPSDTAPSPQGESDKPSNSPITDKPQDSATTDS